MTKTTTDFDTNLGKIIEYIRGGVITSQYAHDCIKAAVSELVKECIGGNITNPGKIDLWVNGFNTAKTEIRQRFKETVL